MDQVPRAIPLGTVKAVATFAACVLAIVGMCIGEARARSERMARAPVAMPGVVAAPPTDPTATTPVSPNAAAEATRARDFGWGTVGQGLRQVPSPSGTAAPTSKLGGRGLNATSQVRALGVPTVSGASFPPEVVGRIVRQSHGRFRLCYESGLRTRPDLAGRVSVKFVIDRSGAVSTASGSSESTLPDQNVIGCIVRSFGVIAFPQPEKGIATVVYRMALTVE